MTTIFTITGICLLAIYSVYFLLNKKISSILDSKKILSTVDEEVSGLILELNQTTERNVLLLEDGIKRLNELLIQSENTILLLKNDIKRNEEKPIHYSHLSKKKTFTPIQDETLKESKKNDENLDDKRRIMELYNKGYSSDVIASKIGASIGEVDLIITLNSRKG